MAVTEVRPGTAMQVPPGWADLGAKTGFDPEPMENLRALILGPPGQGKTTLVSSIPNSLICDYESGSHSVVAPLGCRITIRNYDQYQAIMKKLLDDAKSGKRYFRTIVHDTGDSWCDLLAANFCATHNNCESIGDYATKGAGYGIVRDQAVTDLNTLYYNGYSWVVVGHLKEKTLTVPAGDGTNKMVETTVIRPSMFPTLAAGIWDRADIVATIERERTIERPKIEKTLPNGAKAIIDGSPIERTRYILELSGGTLDLKTRLPSMPSQIELPLIGGWGKLTAAYKEAATKARQLSTGK